MPIPLTDATLPAALADLTARDPRLARIVADYGPPPLWARAPGFPTLIHIILEQQVSLASARAVFDKLCAIADPLTPQQFLELDDATLKAAGFSRQKTRYGTRAGGRDPLRRPGSRWPRRAGRRGGARRADQDRRHRSLDGGHLSADGVGPAGCVAERRSGAGGGGAAGAGFAFPPYNAGVGGAR